MAVPTYFLYHTVSLLWDGIGILFVAHMKSGNAQKKGIAMRGKKLLLLDWWPSPLADSRFYCNPQGKRWVSFNLIWFISGIYMKASWKNHAQCPLFSQLHSTLWGFELFQQFANQRGQTARCEWQLLQHMRSKLGQQNLSWNVRIFGRFGVHNLWLSFFIPFKSYSPWN